MTAVATKAVLLSWVNGESATAVSSDVYFGTDSTPDSSELQGNQAGTPFNPGTLSAGVTYYWRIDQVNAQGTTTRDVWSFTTPKNSANRVKIFILAGQSNTEGHGEMNPIGTKGTLEYLYANDPVTYAHLKSRGNWAVRDVVWIWYKCGGSTLVKGGLTAGYGANSSTIGPELQFGHAMGDYYGEKVLIIKTAWGGKSLRTGFRPPSSGWSLDTPVTAGDEGFYYKETLDFVVDAMANPGLAQVSQSGAVMSFTHPVAEPPLDDVTGSYQWSLDLKTWHSSGTVDDTTVTITAGAPVSGTTTVTADTTGSTVTPARLFIRAVATQN